LNSAIYSAILINTLKLTAFCYWADTRALEKINMKTECSNGYETPSIWAVIIIIILFMIIYAYISSKISERNKRISREKALPATTDALSSGVLYNIFLSDGKGFKNVEIIGSIEGDDYQFAFSGYEGVLILKQETSKKVYVKKASVRYIEEV